MIKINDYYKNAYLTAGVTRDNFVFENCSDEFMDLARNYLSEDANDVISCVVDLDKNIENKLEDSLDLFDSVVHKEIIARDFISALIMLSILKKSGNSVELDALDQGIENVLSGDYKRIRSFLQNAPMPYLIDWQIRKTGKIELNMFLKDIKNKYLQRAINGFLASRTGYSIKVFTNQDRLCSYYDEGGNIIQSPHDYMVRDAREMFEECSLEMQQ